MYSEGSPHKSDGSDDHCYQIYNDNLDLDQVSNSYKFSNDASDLTLHPYLGFIVPSWIHGKRTNHDGCKAAEKTKHGIAQTHQRRLPDEKHRTTWSSLRSVMSHQVFSDPDRSGGVQSSL